ncbi:hypothetical protein Tco_1339168, partial [Tanacetum coccineum]
EEVAGELDLIDPIQPGIDENDFDEEEGAIDIVILQIEDEILREKLLNVNLLVDKFEVSEDSIPPDDDSFTFVVRTFLSYLTYYVVSPLLLSTRSEDTIFDPGIST